VAVLHLRTFSVAPTVDFGDDIIDIVGIRAMLHYPVHGAEKLHPKGCLEAFDERGNTIKASKCFGSAGKEVPRLLDSTREHLKRRIRTVLPIPNAPRVVSLDVAEKIGFARNDGVGC